MCLMEEKYAKSTDKQLAEFLMLRIEHHVLGQ